MSLGGLTKSGLTSQLANQAASEALSKSSKISPKEQQQVRKLAEDFESIFMDIMFQSMRKTVPKSELAGGGNAEEIFRGMLDSEYAKMMAHQRTSGIANSIEKELLKSMENQAASINSVNAQKVYRTQSLQRPANKAKIDDRSGVQAESMLPGNR